MPPFDSGEWNTMTQVGLAFHSIRRALTELEDLKPTVKKNPPTELKPPQSRSLCVG